MPSVTKHDMEVYLQAVQDWVANELTPYVEGLEEGNVDIGGNPPPPPPPPPGH